MTVFNTSTVGTQTSGSVTEPNIQKKIKWTETDRETILKNIQKKQRETQTDRGYIQTNGHILIWTFRFISDKWGKVFDRRFEKLMEIMIIRANGKRYR